MLLVFGSYEPRKLTDGQFMSDLESEDSAEMENCSIYLYNVAPNDLTASSPIHNLPRSTPTNEIVSQLIFGELRMHFEASDISLP